MLESVLMPSRQKIGANKSIFERLDRYCNERNEPILNAGAPRWVHTESKTRDFLVSARLVQKLDLSPSLKAARLDHSGRSFFITLGFEILEVPEGLQAEELSGAVLTAVLSELEIRPIAKPIGIREIVEYSDGTQNEYDGHDCDRIAGLFPTIQVFSTEILVGEESGNVFFLLCLSDRRRQDHWIDDGLTKALMSLSTASATAVPYEVLCRAVLDFDPASLFLALYRSLEALYARGKTLSLRSELGVTTDWIKLAQLLEAHLGWYPKEETSLESLLREANEQDLQKLVEALDETLPDGAVLASFTARRIYALRNSLVHFRPFHQLQPIDKVDWCRLCGAMANLVTEIYAGSVADRVGQVRATEKIEDGSADPTRPQEPKTEKTDTESRPPETT